MTILQMSISAACIIAAATVIRAVALDKLPKQIFQLFWLVACVRLLLPFSFESRLGVYHLLEQAKTPDVVGSGVASVPQSIGMTGAASASVQPTAAGATEVSPFMVIWLVGLAAVAAYLIIVNLKGKRTFAESLPLRHGYTGRWLAQNSIRRTVTVRVSDKVTTPLTYGLVKPVILLPASMNLDDKEQLTYILTHEMLHIKRFDLVKKVALMAVLCIHWFNPMVWVMYVLANRDIELACDEGVLRALGKDANSGYAMALIAMQERKGKASLANCFSRYAIKERITSIMKYKKLSIIAVAVAIALVVGVTTAFASTGAPAAEQQAGKQDDVEITTDSGVVMSHTDEETGETTVSEDGGKTWMAEEEYEAKYPTPDIVWWTAEEYEKWLEQERKDLQEIIGSQGWNPTDGWYTWTQEMVDEAIARYEETLQEIKDGHMHSKTVDGRDDIAVASVPAEEAEIATESGYAAVFSSQFDEEKVFDGYTNKDDLYNDVKAYLEEQVASGSISQKEMDKILADFQ